MIERFLSALRPLMSLAFLYSGRPPFFSIFSAVILSFCLFCGISRAATLSERYGELIGKRRLLLTQDFSYFNMDEDATHASATYGAVDSRPEFTTLGAGFRFGLGPDAEISLAHAQVLPTEYRREIFTPAGALSTVQDYELSHLRDYALAGRVRLGRLEPYLSFFEKRQKTGWLAAMFPAAPSYFSYIRTHFEEAKLGLRFLSDAGSDGGSLPSPRRLEGALLDTGQLDIDAGLAYDSGTLRRNVAYYFGGALIFDNMYHDLKERFAPGVRMAYGISGDLEATGGVTYALPYGYIYEYRRSNAAGLAITYGDYDMRHEMNFPIRLRYRPVPYGEILCTSDISYGQQRLDYWQRAVTGVVTAFPARKLKYLNTRPSVTLAYLFGQGRDLGKDRMARLIETMLAKGQCLLKFFAMRDVTTLDKSAGNGAQNRIDPYNAFLYPLDYFSSGSEYAAYYTGNSSGSATNVAAQNYGLFRLDTLYGITDHLSVGFAAGCRTSSRFHHFTVGSSAAYDLKARSYVLKPYWFFGVPCGWRPAENIFVSLDWYYVPRYRSIVGISGQPKDFEATVEYHSVSLKVQVLF